MIVEIEIFSVVPIHVNAVHLWKGAGTSLVHMQCSPPPPHSLHREQMYIACKLHIHALCLQSRILCIKFSLLQKNTSTVHNVAVQEHTKKCIMLQLSWCEPKLKKYAFRRQQYQRLYWKAIHLQPFNLFAARAFFFFVAHLKKNHFEPED